MNTFGSWKEVIKIGNETFPADRIEGDYARRIGAVSVLALRGLPKEFEEDLIRAAQVCDVPHTWRVRQCSTESEVDSDLLARGREVLERDRSLMGVTIVTYLGAFEGSSPRLEFLAAGAIRNKLTKTFQNDEFPVVSRAIVSPRFRDKGLGTLIVEHRMKSVLRGFYSLPPRAIHFGTESEKVLRSIKKVENDEGVTFAYIGNERYTTADGTHTVKDYLCYLPDYQRALLSSCDRLEEASPAPTAVLEFKKKLQTFMAEGVSGVLGADLALQFQSVQDSLGANAVNVEEDLDRLREVFTIRATIGAEDPVGDGH